MLLNIIFWIVAAIDASVIGLIFVLGLAAAGPSHTSPLSVVGFVLIPGLLLAACVLMFLKLDSTAWRVAALLLAASPMLWVAGIGGASLWDLSRYRNPDGTWSTFRTGTGRALETAIANNDVKAVLEVAKKADLNQTGLARVTPLMLAMSQLEKTPAEFDVLQALLGSGADPNSKNGEILPLVAAIRVSPQAGLEPTRMLLKAGAKPNERDEWGTPAYFSACGAAAPVELMQVLLDAGADMTARDQGGQGPLMHAANTSNWPVVLLLLERGADWRKEKTQDGQDLLSRFESDAGSVRDGKGLAEVIRFLKAASSQGK